MLGSVTNADGSNRNPVKPMSITASIGLGQTGRALRGKG